ncbi:MAG: DUF6261 family protein, partial [Dysgonamonadaceae bacterium]|nr:DUF6261 family protein [Dysgonamonadaceae bacterium]
ELDAAQKEFQSLFRLRSAEKAARPKEKLRDVRKQVDGVYSAIVKMIMALAMVNGESDYAGFADELNAQIKYFKLHGYHQPKKSIKRANMKSIPDQVYEGEPVVVLPEVFVEKKKLVFSVDFDLAYRNNNRPGTATIILHGKGAYKGKAQMSFNIRDK